MHRLRNLAGKIADSFAVSLYLIYLVAESIAERLAQVKSALWQRRERESD